MEESVTESDSDLEDEYEFNVKKALKLSARGHHPFGSKRGRSSSMEDSSSSKKRKADKPKKQSSTISETIGNNNHALKIYDQFILNNSCLWDVKIFFPEIDLFLYF